MKALRLQIILPAAALAAFLPLLTACSGSGDSQPATQVAVQTATAAVQPIAEVIHAQGILYPLHQASLSPKISAPVDRYYVNLGSRVHRGQLLAVLDNRDLKAGVIAARGAYDQARANYESTTTNALPEELLAADAALANAKSSLAEQQRLYTSESNLYKEGAIPRKQVDATAVALTAAKNAYKTALKRLRNLQSSGARQQVDAARGQMEAAHGQYLGAQAQFGYTEIRSPIDGFVTSRAVWPGDVAPAGTPLLVVMDTSQVVLRLHIPEPQAAQLHLGDPATLNIPGVHGGVPARVSIVNSALDPGSTTVEVWLVADNPHHRLAPGASVEATIVVRKVPDALVIPASALLVADSGLTTVMTVGPGSLAQSHTVTTGIRNNGLVQILSGLHAGDQVISTGAWGLADKTKVSAQPQSQSPSSSPAGGQD